MGWVGAGVAIATTAYFFYRYPPRSRAEPHSLAPPEPKPETPLAATSDAPVQEKHDSRSPTPPIDSEEDTQSTPKASASSAPLPVFAVPELNLESEGSTSQPATMPSIPPPTSEVNGQSSLEDRRYEGHTSSSQSPSLSAPSQPKQPSVPRSAPASSSSLMPPPPAPRPTPQPNRDPRLQPPRLSGSSLGPPPSAAASQRGAPMSGVRQVNSTLAPTPVSLKKASKRVILEPGFSPLDWAARAANPNNQLRGKDLPPGLLRVTPSMLRQQHGRKGRDAWTSYNGKVYNISPYAPYHPGGKGELLRGAGKDSGQLFMEIHPWVNWDGILGECLVGILVSENDIQTENALDAMD
ncbi:unnamed protein product [Penicillium salamii]|uniref:Cytochrome b5 heme-binding domain-containing protein n=1 Tax=Penicillium salamii TaxID=1612424 RepID=A0A9W4N7P2_9EURO|nr:unnamed protein product [Penicillium salamii]CAG8107080.1 unnamed protein product [Penicillium salamii]CAG8282673.1 unnamed protein product [Penicillium salamii]CAG8301051.1 unnamed protein product [Penicillium salamii]CAG8385617.1 unnamed protein product [Penicillium salamii]